MKQYVTTKNPIVGPLGGQHDTPPGSHGWQAKGVEHAPLPPGGVRDEAVGKWSTFAKRFGNLLPHNINVASRLYDVNKMLANADKIKSTIDLQSYRRNDTPEYLFGK